MNKIKILTDTSSNLTFEKADEFGIGLFRFSINTDSGSYRDLIDLSPEQFYNKLKTENVRTSVPSPIEYEKFLEKYLKAGYAKFLAMPISKKLSGMAQMMEIVVEDLKEKYDFEFEMIDTYNTAGGLGLAVEAVSSKIKDIDDLKIAKSIAEKYCGQIQNYAILKNLTYMSKGGRIPKSIAALGNFLGISPVLKIENGEVSVEKMIKGKKKSYNYLINKIKEETSSMKEFSLFFHTGVDEDTTVKMKEDLSEEIKRSVHVEEGILTSVLGVHLGTDMYGIALLNKDIN